MPLPLHAPQQDEQHKEDIACSLEGLTRLSPPTFPFIGTFVDHSLVLAAIDKDRLLKDLTLQNEAARFGYLETPLHQYQEMLFDFDGGPGVPQQWALLSGNLIRRLGACVNSAHEMVYAAFARGEESLTDFSADTLNHYNKVYYSSQSAFDDLPSLFTENEQVASAFAGYLQTELTNLEPRLLELCAGVNSLGRWNHYFSKIPQTHKATLFLADGSYGNSSQSLIPDISSNISLSTQPFNLLGDPRALINLGTFDRIFLCYGADSVWFPGDIHLIKNGGEWFQALTRVSVPDWHPKRELVIQAFKDLNGAKLEADDSWDI